MQPLPTNPNELKALAASLLGQLQARDLALGRRNWLFAGSEAGGKRAAQMYSLISSAKMNSHEPLAYLTDILERLPTARMKDLEARLPWNWTPQRPVMDFAAALDKPPRPLILVPN